MMRVYWTNIEYQHVDVDENNNHNKGMVYVFVQSRDAISALNKIIKSNQFKDKKITKCEFICPYNVDMEEWNESVEFGSPEETTNHYKKLYEFAMQSRNPVFDYFWEYKK